MQRFATGLLGCTLLLSSHPATAQSPVKSRAARADLLFQQAQALLDTGHVAAACVKFEASETAENRLDTLLHLADCYQREGRLASAWHTFLQAEAVSRNERNREHEQAAAQRVAALEPRLTRVVFLVPTTSRVPGLTLRLGANTVPATSWGVSIPVDAGVQHVSAAAAGYDPWTVEIDASHGEGQQFRVNVPALSPVAGSQAANARRNAYRTAGVVTGSFGLAGLGAGAVFSAMSRNASDAKSCSNSQLQCTPSPSNKSALSDAATVSFALGGTLLATGVTLFVLAPSPDKQEKNALRVAARYASSGGRLQLEGSW
jgi:hypothetical protein